MKIAFTSLSSVVLLLVATSTFGARKVKTAAAIDTFEKRLPALNMCLVKLKKTGISCPGFFAKSLSKRDLFLTTEVLLSNLPLRAKSCSKYAEKKLKNIYGKKTRPVCIRASKKAWAPGGFIVILDRDGLISTVARPGLTR